jgi:hypothetical protein
VCGKIAKNFYLDNYSFASVSSEEAPRNSSNFMFHVQWPFFSNVSSFNVRANGSNQIFSHNSFF